MCAAPFAPPPASTRPIRGRDGVVGDASCAVAVAQSGPSNASTHASERQLCEGIKPSFSASDEPKCRPGQLGTWAYIALANRNPA